MKSTLVRVLPRLSRACVVAVAFLAPVFFLPLAADGFQLVKMLVLGVLGVVGVGAWVMTAAERRAWLPSTRLLPVVGVFLAVVAVASALSRNPALSLVGLYSRYGGLIPLAIYVAFAVLVVGLWWERPEGVAALAWSAVAAAIPGAVYVVLQAHRIVERHVKYPPGTIGNSNFSGAYLAIAAPAVIYGFVAVRNRLARVALAATGLLVLVALWETRSRGAMLATAAAIGVGVLLSVRRRQMRALLIVVALVLTAGAGALVIRGSSTAKPSAKDSNLLRSDTLASRTDYWRVAWHLWLEHPVLGTGPDTFFSQYPPNRRASDGANFGLTLPDKPHDIYLEWAVSSGLLGVGTYLVLVVMVLAYGARRTARLEGKERALLTALLAMFSAYLVQAVFSIDQPPLAVTAWLLIAAIVVMADPGLVRARRRQAAAVQRVPEGGESRHARRAARHRARWPVHIAVVVVVAAVTVVAGRVLVADIDARSSELAARKHPTGERAVRLAHRAVHLDPAEATYQAVLGDAAERHAQALADTDTDAKRELYATARARYRKALRMRPGHLYYLIAIARVDTSVAQEVDPTRWPIADRSWTDVVNFDPTDWEVHDLYATALNSWANAAGGDPALRRRTAEELTETVRIRPIYVGGWLNLAKVQAARGDLSAARAALQQVYALDPANPDAPAVASQITNA
jgi:O-antigen ligase